MAIVKCRICKQPINKNKTVEGVDWVMPSRNWYYHKECYETWRKGKDDIKLSANSREEWELYIFDYLKRDVRMNYNYMMCKSQIENFLKKGYTLKGMFFTLKYFYEVVKGDVSKSKGGIGIIPSVYEDAKAYWVTRINKQSDIMEVIQKQIQERNSQNSIIVRKRKKAKRYESNLADIGESVNE